MIKNLTFLVLMSVFPWVSHAEKMEYHPRGEINSLDISEIGHQNWKETNSLQLGIIESAIDLPELPIKQNPDKQFSETALIQQSDSSEPNPPQSPFGNNFEGFSTGEFNTENAQNASFHPLAPQLHTNMLSKTEELLNNYVGENYNLGTIIEETVTLAQQINTAWNDLDDQVTYKLYQGLGYLGVTDVFNNGENPYVRVHPTIINENPFDSNLAPDTKNYVEPEGVFWLIFKLPKLFTFHNFIIMMILMLAGNGLFRVIRYILLRI
ncbi:MAG: hypothetical protein ACU83N_06595 [Gammaproteobacteria bacterium]